MSYELPSILYMSGGSEQFSPTGHFAFSGSPGAWEVSSTSVEIPTSTVSYFFILGGYQSRARQQQASGVIA